MAKVLVTGGTIRVGKAIADHLRSLGHEVVASSHRPEAGPSLDCLDVNDFDVIINNAALYLGEPTLVKRVNYDIPVAVCEAKTHGQVINILDGTSHPAPWKKELAEYTVGRVAPRPPAVTESPPYHPPRCRVNGILLGPVLPPDGFHLKADPCPKGRPTVNDVAKAVVKLVEDKDANHLIIDVTGR